MITDTDLLELTDRYSTIVSRYGELAIEIAQKLDQFGKYRKELHILREEFAKHGYTPENSQDLVKKIEEELAKQELNVTQTDKSQTNS